MKNEEIRSFGWGGEGRGSGMVVGNAGGGEGVVEGGGAVVGEREMHPGRWRGAGGAECGGRA